MINYLEKYNNLPKDLRDKISAPHVMKAIHEIEEKHTVNLAALIMRVMVRDIGVDELRNFFVFEQSMEATKADALVKELRERVFSEIANYLDYISTKKAEEEKVAADELGNYAERFGLTPGKEEEAESESKPLGANFYFSIEDEDEVRKQAKDMGGLDRREQIAAQVEAQIDKIIGEINVIFSSEDMLRRLRQIIKTYLRGVRDKIDTKQALERDIMSGGLSLDEEIADDILSIVDKLNDEETKHPGRIVAPKKFILPEDMMKEAVSGVAGAKTPMRDAAYDFGKLSARKPAAPSAEDAMIKFDSGAPSNETSEEESKEESKEVSKEVSEKVSEKYLKKY
jgi:hypothetical protein